MLDDKMPLFHGSRDAGLIHKFNMELINDIIDTEVAIYKLSLENTKTNLYSQRRKTKSFFSEGSFICYLRGEKNSYSI